MRPLIPEFHRACIGGTGALQIGVKAFQFASGLSLVRSCSVAVTSRRRHLSIDATVLSNNAISAAYPVHVPSIHRNKRSPELIFCRRVSCLLMDDTVCVSFHAPSKVPSPSAAFALSALVPCTHRRPRPFVDLRPIRKERSRAQSNYSCPAHVTMV